MRREAGEQINRAEAETERVRREGNEQITRLDAEAERLRREADAQTKGAEADAERIGREAGEQIKRIENDAYARYEQLRAAAGDEVNRLAMELAEAKERAERAEQWLVRIRKEVEVGLLQSFTRPRNGAAEPSGAPS